jgi:DNA-binding CsgD family transcriptional regulator
MTPASETLDRIARSGEAVFATDTGDRIILWNKKCETLLGRSARSVLGKRCYEVLGGRDVFGNMYCHKSCPVAFQARQDTQVPVNRFALSVDVEKAPRRFEVSIFAIPSYHPALSTLVHVIRDGPMDSALERQLTNEAEIREPLWPMTAQGGHTIELSARELEILRCLAQGMDNAAIARQLFISAVTVRNHIANILQKLDVHTKLAAVVFAYQHNLFGTTAA